MAVTEEEHCKLILDAPYVEPGWGCCACKRDIGAFTYNSIARPKCKRCGHKRCTYLPQELVT